MNSTFQQLNIHAHKGYTIIPSFLTNHKDLGQIYYETELFLGKRRFKLFINSENINDIELLINTIGKIISVSYADKVSIVLMEER